MLTQTSFQLSFLAVAAMFVPGRLLSKRWELKGLAEQIWISVSLQVMTFPFVLLHSYEIPLYSIFLNFVVVPLMIYVLVSGILGIVCSFVNTGLGIMSLGAAHGILALYRQLCDSMQMIPGANLILGRPAPWALILYYGLLVGGTLVVWKGRKCGLFFWGLAVLLVIPWPRPGLFVTVLDVGQGDGIVLEANGNTVLVDCGSSQRSELGEKVLVPYLKSQGIGYLEAVIVTHGDQDHVSGIRELLEDQESGIEIGQLIFSKAGGMDSACRELADIAQRRDISVRYCGAGDTLHGILGEKAEIYCLHPKEHADDIQIQMKAEYPEEADRNGDSIVLYISYGSFSLLLTGDIGKEEEQRLMETYHLGTVTVLKAAHHGSANSNSREFLECIRPGYVIFSYGEGNPYGHPASSVVESCRELGCSVLKTAEEGAVRIWTDGDRMQVEGWLDRRNGI